MPLVSSALYTIATYVAYNITEMETVRVSVPGFPFSRLDKDGT